MVSSQALDKYLKEKDSPSINDPFDLFELVSQDYALRVKELLAENWFTKKPIPYSIQLAIDEGKRWIENWLAWLNLNRGTRFREVVKSASNDDNYALQLKN